MAAAAQAAHAPSLKQHHEDGATADTHALSARLDALENAKRHFARFLRNENLGAILVQKQAESSGDSKSAHLGPESRYGEPPLLLLHDDTVRDALASLAARGVLSAPVVGETWVLERWAFGNKMPGTAAASVTPEGQPLGELTYFGFIDVFDIVGALCAATRQNANANLSHKQWTELLKGSVGQAFLNRRVLDTLGHDGDLLWRGFTRDRSIFDACNHGLLSVQPHSSTGRTPAGVASHRCAIFDVRGRVTDVISQSDILHWILENSGELGVLATAKISELKLGSTGVVSVPASVPVVDAFARLHASSKPCLAVVDDDTGALLSNLSASDLRGVSAAHLEALAMPTGQYLALTHGLQYGRYTWKVAETGEDGLDLGFEGMGIARDTITRLPIVMRREAHDAVSCGQDTTLLHVMELLSRKNVHHVYVCDSANKPMAVISIGDVLRCVCGGSSDNNAPEPGAGNAITNV